jgi:Glyoxalase-like domain
MLQPMPGRIDHVIIAGSDLDALEERFTRLGFFVTGGGTHPHLGTRNRIIVLDDSYIELLTVADPDLASPALEHFISTGGGWAGYALQSDNIGAETSAMRARGVDARGPTPGQLAAKGGGTRNWRVTMVGTDDLWEAAIPLPFLIQHDSTGEAHRLELAGAGGLPAHPNGASRLNTVRIFTGDGGALAGRYQAVYDFPEEALTAAASTTSPSWRFNLASGEYVSIDEISRFREDYLGSRRVARMNVQVQVGDLAAIEELHWHATVISTLNEHTLIVRIPGIDAEIECTGPGRKAISS